MQQGQHLNLHKVTASGLLITLGIIFGDIGTSPLYVLKAIVGEAPLNAEVILGGVSCIFWTLTLQTTIKYVILTLRADNKGEGGIFSLYTLVRRTKVRWLVVPAVIGGSSLLADGIITPSISVSSAVEGLNYFNPGINTAPIVIAILTALFLVQQFGTSIIGKSFGPVMLVWFMMLGIIGIYAMSYDWGIIKALNPYYAYNLLLNHPGGFWLLGAVFLCTTGAEGLYSDMGHCGRKNIRVSWYFVKAMLLLNYFGQGAWLLSLAQKGEVLDGRNPFYSVMPDSFLWIGIIVATCATIVASQALISASFTLINEAIRLNLWPKVLIKYPTETRGQLYIPSINWILYFACIAVVLYFKESAHMEAAYGLTININMIMTSILLIYFMRLKRFNFTWIVLYAIIYFVLEFAFLGSNLNKFMHGGWVSLFMSSILIFVMICWMLAKKIRHRYIEMVKVNDYMELIKELSRDQSVSKYATHLVYLTRAQRDDEIEAKVIYSILQKQPKRADIYWFVHVNVVDEPYKMEYKVTEFVHNDLIRVDFNLGFRVAPRINLMFRKVVQDMVKNKEVDIISRYASLNSANIIGDFRFIVIEKILSIENALPFHEKIILKAYEFLNALSISEERAFGLDTSSVTVEKFPLIIAPVENIDMKRVE